jgi:hypothetical protein
LDDKKLSFLAVWQDFYGSDEFSPETLFKYVRMLSLYNAQAFLLSGLASTN